MSDDATKTWLQLRQLAGELDTDGNDVGSDIATAAAQLIERQAAEIDRLTLRWSSERPTDPGKYLVRFSDGDDRETWISEFRPDLPPAWDRPRQFAGPIPDPLEQQETTNE
jgi:hypothetical protein